MVGNEANRYIRRSTDPRSQDAVQLITSEPTCDQGSVLVVDSGDLNPITQLELIPGH